MAKYWRLILVAVVTSGCTTVSLQHYTLDQIHSVEEYRVNSTLDCLAMVASQPDTLPSLALLVNGYTHVQDTGTATSITNFTRLAKGFATESFAASVNQSPTGDWNVDPVANFSQLDALRAACRWAVFGPQAAWDESPGLLLDPVSDYSPQHPHYGVANRLSRLPSNWVHVGCKKDVPKCAAYSAHCGDAYVWIMPQERWCFFEFMLVLHDIATTDPDNGVYSPPLLVTITRTFPAPDKCVQAKDPNANGQMQGQGQAQGQGQTMLQFAETRVVRPEWRQWVEAKLAQAYDTNTCVDIDEQHWLAATYAHSGTRTSSKAASNGKPDQTLSGQAVPGGISPERWTHAQEYLRNLGTTTNTGAMTPNVGPSQPQALTPKN